MSDSNDVFVQVVPLDEGGEIGFGTSITQRLDERLQDIRGAIAAGARSVASSLGELATAEGWQLGEVSAKFGVTLTAQAGVIVSQTSAGATFEVTVRYLRKQ